MSVSKRLISEYLASDEADNIDIKGSISIGQSLIMEAGDNPTIEGMFMRVGANGQIYGYKAQNTDLEWVESNTGDIVAASSETQLLTLTIDNDITQENGSWAFTCKINNGSSNKDDFSPLPG